MGFLLALEGIDGSGTTSQASRLKDHLERRGKRVVLTAEPSRGPVGQLLRQSLMGENDVGDVAMALLFAADRLDHLSREIEPALLRGDVVLTDRYLLSSLAYQSSYLPLDWVQQLNARARLPDASILLDVRHDVAKARRAARGGAAERFDDDARQQRIAKAYREVFERKDVGPVHVLDANGAIDSVTTALTAIVDRLLPR